MKAQEGWSRSLLNINKIPTNTLVLIFGTILLIFLGASISILLFTYYNSIKIIEQNRDLNKQALAELKEIPLQNLQMLLALNETVSRLQSNQELLQQHVIDTENRFDESGFATNQNQQIIPAGLYNPPEVRSFSMSATDQQVVSQMRTLLNQVNNTLRNIEGNQSMQEILNAEEGSIAGLPSSRP